MLTFKHHLNPIVNRLADIASFSEISPKDIYLEEYPYLQSTTNITYRGVIRQLSQLEKLEAEIETQVYVIENETGDDKGAAVSTYNKMLKQAKDLTDSINRKLAILDIPYFGKIIFKRKASAIAPAAQITSYIGKLALFDEDTNATVITDWRAPIANLYYTNQGPKDNVQFQAPNGTQEGNLTQKRQFEISGARIHNIYDAKTGNAAADEFLLSQLKGRIGKKLADIVATIQDQQNEIIRDSIDKPIIIQGVAGSGKTTILLHRIAYLLYTYPKKIRPNQSLIIAPNKMFLDYISDVLPSLGVEGLEQNTYVFWAKNLLSWGNKFTAKVHKEDLEIKEYKGSTEFIKLIDKFFADFEQDLFNKMPDPLNTVIAERYFELSENQQSLSTSERVNLAIEYAFAQQQFRKTTIGNFMGNLDSEKSRMSTIKSYAKKRLSAYKLYKEMFKFEYIFKDSGLSEKFSKKLRKETTSNMSLSGRLNTFSTDDLPAMVYLHLKINGTKDYMRDCVIADEAQDLSLFQILTLSMVARSGNITLAGDLAQSIIPPFYIKDWNTVLDLFKERIPTIKDYSYHQLYRCYRTTIEIIDFANNIFEERFPKSYRLPEAVLRHGQPPQFIELSKNLTNASPDDIKTLINQINKEFEQGSVTVALVCRDVEHCQSVYDNLSIYESSFNRPITSYQAEDYHEGLLILPVSHAKGLEFDTVIVADANEELYPETEHNVRLMYVAITRALHRLYFIVTDKRSRLLPALK